MEDKYSFLSGMKRSCRTGEQKCAAATRRRGEGKFAQVHRKTKPYRKVNADCREWLWLVSGIQCVTEIGNVS